MPYTLSHIGFVTPLFGKNKYFSRTGLVFGSIVPDFDILFRLTNVRFHLFDYGVFCVFFQILPLTLILIFLYQTFCRDVLIDVLFKENEYSTQYKSEGTLKIFTGRSMLKLIFSIVVAIYIHIILDTLTHHLDAYDVKMYIWEKTRSDFFSTMAYYSAMYIPMIILSIIGFYLLCLFLIKQKSFPIILKKKLDLKFIIVFAVSFLLVFTIKVFIKESDSLILDFYMINFTSSLIGALYMSCICYYIVQRLRTQSI